MRVGLVTTAGFEDSLPVAKGRRVNDGIWSVYPDPILPRAGSRACASGSTGTDGCSSRSDPREAVEAAAARRRASGRVTRRLVPVVLPQPDHELQAAAAIRGAFPSLPVISGADRQPTIREFERTAYAVLNAYAVAAVPASISSPKR